VVGNAITYTHKDKQYVGVLSGIGGWAGVAMNLGMTNETDGLGSAGGYKDLVKYNAASRRRCHERVQPVNIVIPGHRQIPPAGGISDATIASTARSSFDSPPDSPSIDPPNPLFRIFREGGLFLHVIRQSLPLCSYPMGCT